MKIMPENPTEEMIEAYSNASIEGYKHPEPDMVKLKQKVFEMRYKAMYAAAPTVDGEPVSGVVIRECLPTLIHDKYVKNTDIRLFTFPPDAAAKIAQLESAIASHKPIFDMLSGIDDVDTTPQEGDTSFVCILKELIANERQAQKDKAELVEALVKARLACVIASDAKYDEGMEDAAQDWQLLNERIATLLAKMKGNK